jgi:hypothetical protein
MPEANTDTTPHSDSDVTLSALAATLGEIEPPGEDDDLEPVHICRADVLEKAAQFLPVKTAVDAVLALSLVARIHNDVTAIEHSEAEREMLLTAGTAILAQTVRWLMEAHGVTPLRTHWLPDATPFPETSTPDPGDVTQMLRECLDRLRPPSPEASR